MGVGCENGAFCSVEWARNASNISVTNVGRRLKNVWWMNAAVDILFLKSGHKEEPHTIGWWIAWSGRCWVWLLHHFRGSVESRKPSSFQKETHWPSSFILFCIFLFLSFYEFIFFLLLHFSLVISLVSSCFHPLGLSRQSEGCEYWRESQGSIKRWWSGRVSAITCVQPRLRVFLTLRI